MTRLPFFRVGGDERKRKHKNQFVWRYLACDKWTFSFRLLATIEYTAAFCFFLSLLLKVAWKTSQLWVFVGWKKKNQRHVKLNWVCIDSVSMDWVDNGQSLPHCIFASQLIKREKESQWHQNLIAPFVDSITQSDGKNNNREIAIALASASASDAAQKVLK